MWTFRTIKDDHLQDLIVFLKSVSYFQSLPHERVATLAHEFQAVSLKSGETLIREGEQGDSLYIVQSGRLLVIKNSNSAQEQVLSEIGRGELVGELALFTDQARAANVIAIRDSVLWKLSKAHFDVFVQNNSAYIMPMVRAAILRLLEPKKISAQSLRTLAIAPAGRYPISSDFVRLLVDSLSLVAPTLLVTAMLMRQHIPDLIDSPTEIQLSHSKVTQWLNEQEHLYSYVLYETDAMNSEWTQLCLRQADKIIFIGEARDSAVLGDIEHYLFHTLDINRRLPVDLILLHEPTITLPSNTIQWLENRPKIHIHHIKRDKGSDLERVVRLILGQGVGLVLGGGGAKSLAHIGVYKALCELNIPIDRVCGTSMGGVIGAAIAMDLPVSTMVEVIEEKIIKNKKFNDYTIPLVSLLGGVGWLNVLKLIFGEQVQIEDLWKNFFCIASNFTLRRIEVLNRGVLYRALRASASLPGVVPPISNESNELLIDGGIFNNLPVDIMRDLASPCKIIAVRVSPFSNVHARIPDGIVSGLKRYIARFGSAEPSGVPSFSEIISGAITLCNDEKEAMQLNNADCALDIDLNEFATLDFSKLHELIDVGYKTTMEQFASGRGLSLR